jgi:teichuronic acid biosynthesis glycosyltransferase TuaC
VCAVTNMYPTPEAPTSGVFVDQQIQGLRRIGLLVDVFVIDRLGEGRSAYSWFGPRLRHRLREFRPDLVHVMYGGVMAERVTRYAKDVPVIVTYHGSDLQGAQGSSAARRVMAEYGVWCSRRAARRASGIVIVAEHLETRIPRDVDRNWLRIIACGIDLERFKPMDTEACRRHLGWSSGRFHVLFSTNNDDPVKRPGLARAAVDSLIEAGIDASLHVLKGVPNDEVPVWLNASDVILVTSWSEGSPTIVKEALACNRPVVSVAVGDVAAQIGGISGCHVAAADRVALADKMKLVYSGPRQVRGRERMADQSLEPTAERLKEFYEEVIARQAVGMGAEIG